MYSLKKTLIVLPILCSTAHAGMAVEGDKINISYGDGGTWSNRDYEQCLTYLYDGSWVDFCEYGYDWQVLSASYVVDGFDDESVTGSTYEGWDWESATLVDTSDGDRMGSEVSFDVEEVAITKTESWAEDGSTITIDIAVTNISPWRLDDVVVMWGIDADQGCGFEGGTCYRTYNDALDPLDEGAQTYVKSSVDEGLTIGLGSCDAISDDVGYQRESSGFPFLSSTFAELSDPDDSYADGQIAWRHRFVDSIGPDESLAASFFVVVADTELEAEEAYRFAMH